MCAEALKFYANEQSKAGMVKAMKIPAMIAAALLGTVALGGSSAVIGQANMKVSTMGLSDVPVEHFATVVRRHVRPVPYSTPASLAIQRFATSFPFVDG
ncbi:hypothetical protein GGD67_003871 [Bradyrhizobium sp. IAR9]|uniref:hypothetical protein n=1 Tax=Bradyrhizobium sp. IAR9 TaxID=2663841 RepID=UPI0015C6CEEE|nr:hypothetical protein [Bradyrhizobium sp. IAR9]NYG46400.1 hypothetical protein [Bradyrhizobium sp. IAR9]